MTLFDRLYFDYLAPQKTAKAYHTLFGMAGPELWVLYRRHRDFVQSIKEEADTLHVSFNVDNHRMCPAHGRTNMAHDASRDYQVVLPSLGALYVCSISPVWKRSFSKFHQTSIGQNVNDYSSAGIRRNAQSLILEEESTRNFDKVYALHQRIQTKMVNGMEHVLRTPMACETEDLKDDYFENLVG